MITQDPTNSILRIGNITGDAGFKIKASSKAFKILSGQLYSNKILAVVREYSTNAVDSHIQAGKPSVPFHIHLPNKLEPFLIIQDYGVGISHEDIYEIYTTYFLSTKETTNEQSGCLGLGNKSGFSYTDSFLITSIFNGVKRIYHAYFNESDCPTIALMSTENTNDCNGVSIQIPVNEGDFNTFVNEVKTVCRFFKVKPTITGGSIEWNTDKVTFSGEKWESYESLDHGKGYVVQGQICYPIEQYQLSYEHRQIFEHSGLVIYADMGDVSFTPSRESLSYDESTKAWLNAKMEFIAKDFGDKLVESIANKDNIYEAMKAVNLILTKFSFLKSISKGLTFMWNGIDISLPTRLLTNETMGMALTHYYKSYGRSKIKSSNNIALKGKWFNEDLSRGGEGRVKTYVKSLPSYSNNDKDFAMYFSKEAYNALIAFGIPTDAFTATSTLPKPIKVSNSSGGVTLLPTELKINILIRNKTYDPYKFKNVICDENDLPKFYIIQNSTYDFSFKIKSDKLINSIYSVDELVKILICLGYDSTDICMVTSKKEERMIDNGSINFQTFLTDYLDNTLTYNESDILNVRKFGSSVRYHSLQMELNWHKLSNDHPVKAFVKEVIDCNVRFNKLSNIINYIKISDVNTNEIELVSDCPIMKLAMSRINSWSSVDIVNLLVELEKKELALELELAY